MSTIYPGVDLIMTTLQQIYPRRIYPAHGTPTKCPIGWTRGGTSPGGASLGGHGGNYYIGNAERYINDSAPQRIIWTLPGIDDEEWSAPQTVGFFVDPTTKQLPTLNIPQTPSTATQYRQLGNQSAVPFATRIIPLRAHCWGHDIPDTEELGHWLAAAAQVAFCGITIGPSGWADDPKGSRGVHWVLTVRLAAPVYYPSLSERPMERVELGLDVRR